MSEQADVRSLRVLHLIPSLVGGGAERQLAYTAAALAQQGVQVHVGYIHDGPNLEHLSRSEATLHRIECAGNHDPLIFWRILRLVRAIRPHVVQTWLLQMDVFGGLASRAMNVPWVLSERSSSKMYERGWKFRLRRLVGSHATAVAANSEAGLGYWSGARGLGRVIPNIVDVEGIRARMHQRESIDGIGDEDRLILFAGRFHEEKNVFTLLEAVDSALGRNTDAKALFFGDGPLKERLLARKAQMENSRRIHVGGYSDSLPYWMNRASAFVSASSFEGMPNAVIEAAICDCPLIVSDIPGHRGILAEEMAWFVPHGSASEIADALTECLDYPARARAHAAAARGQFERWTSEHVARRYIALYEQLEPFRKRSYMCKETAQVAPPRETNGLKHGRCDSRRDHSRPDRRNRRSSVG